MTASETDGPNYGILTYRFVSSGQWDRALVTSIEWLGLEPENLQAHRVAAQSLVYLGRESEAQMHLTRVLAGNPNDDFSLRLLSIVQFAQGEFESADQSIRMAIALNPRDAYHWYQHARMRYNKGELPAARKYAEQARELNSRDSNILNLLILCEPNHPGLAAEKIRRYEDALELDPENAYIHNNIGTLYFDALEYSKAEECFRRALFFNPSSTIFRQNLFKTIKHRDFVYRTLCAPKDYLFKVINAIRDIPDVFGGLHLLIFIPFAILAWRYSGMWFLWVWPLKRVYEYLTIGNILARMGELDTRRGGFWGYRKWPLKLSLSLFAVFWISFWSFLYSFFTSAEWGALGLLMFFKEDIYMMIIFIPVTASSFWVARIIANRLEVRAARRRPGASDGNSPTVTPNNYE